MTLCHMHAQSTTVARQPDQQPAATRKCSASSERGTICARRAHGSMFSREKRLTSSSLRAYYALYLYILPTSANPPVCFVSGLTAARVPRRMRFL